MNATRLVVTLAALALAASPPAMAQGRSTPEVRLQAAVHAEVVEGDLERAARLYRELAADRAAPRPVTAMALVNLGRTYERLGHAQARAAYDRVVREYADQAEPARLARQRLLTLNASIGDNAASREPTSTMVLGELPDMFDVSPSGDRVALRLLAPAGRESEERVTRLVITDQGGAVTRLVAEGEPVVRRIRSPRWSPDGRLVSYLEVRTIDAESLAISLMIAPVDTGAPRAVLTRRVHYEDNIGGPATGGVFWTPDARAITFGTRHGIETVDLEGRTVRELPFRMPYRTQITGYSPDGRWIALHQAAEGSEQQEQDMDVWILPAAGGRAIRLTDSPGFDGWPTWSADGRAVYFVSRRSGSDNVWRVELEPRSGLPRGEPQQATFYTDVTIHQPKLVDGGRRLSFGLQRTTSVIHVAPSGNPTEGRSVARGRFGTLSPDGRTVYYLSQGIARPGIFAVPAGGGEPRRLTTGRPGGPSYQPFALSPDGGTIAFFQQAGAHNALFTVPTGGGEPRELLRFESREALVPSWSSDGMQLAYSHGNGLYAIAATGGEPRRLAQLYGWDGWTVRWSPDGAHVAALGWTAPETRTNQNAVFVVPAEGGEPRRLTPPGETGYKEVLEWHPDGRRLSYMYYGDNGSGDGSRVAYLDGSPTSLLVDQPAPLWDYVGNWSPDGRGYFFVVSRFATGWSLYVHDDATRATSMVVPGTAGSVDLPPSFSPDGRTMAYSVSRTVRQLWSMEGFR